jgi:hypothetical protein
VGNNAGLSADLAARDGTLGYRSNVNQYNTGSGYASQADFLNNHDTDMQASNQIASYYGTPSNAAGLTSIADMKKLGLWG